jgi:hypothetical protein
MFKRWLLDRFKTLYQCLVRVNTVLMVPIAAVLDSVKEIKLQRGI